MQLSCATIVLLSTLLMESAASAAAASETKRIRDGLVHKSKANSARINKGGESIRTPQTKKEHRELEVDIAIDSSFSINVLANLSLSFSLSPSESGSVITDESYDPFLGMGSLPNVAIDEAPEVDAELPETPMCSFCDGIVDYDRVLPDEDGTSCETVFTSAGLMKETDELCTQIKEAEIWCCPITPETPCEFCLGSNGITVPADLVIPQSEETTCGVAVMYAASIEDTAEECITVKMAESICCPNSNSVSTTTAPVGSTNNPIQRPTVSPGPTPPPAAPSREQLDNLLRPPTEPPSPGPPPAAPSREQLDNLLRPPTKPPSPAGSTPSEDTSSAITMGTSFLVALFATVVGIVSV